MLFNLLGFLVMRENNPEVADMALKQTGIVLLGVVIGIVGIAMIISGSKAASLVTGIATTVATKGKSLAA